MYGRTIESNHASAYKSIKLWSYSRPYVTGVFYWDNHFTTEQDGESHFSFDSEVSEGKIVVEVYNDIYYDIMEEEFRFDESVIEVVSDVQLSTG